MLLLEYKHGPVCKSAMHSGLYPCSYVMWLNQPIKIDRLVDMSHEASFKHTVCGQVCTIAEESTSDDLLLFCFFFHLFPVCVIYSEKVKDNSDNL